MKKDNLQSTARNIVKTNRSLANNTQTHSQSRVDKSFASAPFNNGVMMKDACNPSPGFGIWASDNNHNDKGGQNNNGIKELLERHNIQTSDHLINKTNQIIIDKLKDQCKDLNSKYVNALSGYYERENRAVNAELMRKEYKEITSKVIEEKQKLEIQNHQLEEVIVTLKEALENTKKEIVRLTEIVECDKAYVKELNIKFEQKLANEQKKFQDMKKEISILRGTYDKRTQRAEEISISQGKSRKNMNSLLLPLKSTPLKDEAQIKMLSDLILELRLEISELKRAAKVQEEEKRTLHDIIKYKDKKNLVQRQNIDGLCLMMEEKDKASAFNNQGFLHGGRTNSLKHRSVDNNHSMGRYD